MLRFQPMPGLWTPPTGVQLMERSTRTRTVTLKNGKRAKVTIEGTPGDGFVKHVETDESIDAVVRPRTVKVSWRTEQ